MMRWHPIVAAFFILNGIGGFDIVDRMLFGQWLGKPGDKLTLTLNLLTMIAGIALFIRGRKRIDTIRTGVTLVSGLVALMICSVLWSIEPPTTIRYSLIYLFIIAGSIGMATNFSPKEYTNIFAWVCFLTAAVSLILWVVAPGTVTSESGDFRGVYSQKNIIGEAMLVGVITSIYGIDVSARTRWRNWIFVIVDAVATLESKSTTSTMAILCCLVIYGIIVLGRKGSAGRSLATLAWILFVPTLLILNFFSEALLETIGKDPTLTGRSVIWSYVITYIYQKPLFGWGYEGFWSITSAPALEIADAINWFSPQAHNGLLEIMIHLGLVGAGFYLYSLGRTIWLALQCLHTSNRALGASTLMLCSAIIVEGISEAVLVHPFGAPTSIFFVMGFFCERSLRTSRQAAVPRRSMPNMARIRARQTLS